MIACEHDSIDSLTIAYVRVDNGFIRNSFLSFLINIHAAEIRQIDLVRKNTCIEFGDTFTVFQATFEDVLTSGDSSMFLHSISTRPSMTSVNAAMMAFVRQRGWRDVAIIHDTDIRHVQVRQGQDVGACDFYVIQL